MVFLKYKNGEPVTQESGVAIAFLNETDAKDWADAFSQGVKAFTLPLVQDMVLPIEMEVM